MYSNRVLVLCIFSILRVYPFLSIAFFLSCIGVFQGVLLVLHVLLGNWSTPNCRILRVELFSQN